jgi:hypothetical protein
MDCMVRLGNGRAIGRTRVNVFARLDVHEAVIVTILQRVMDIIDPPITPEPPKPRIGFSP